MDTTVTEIDDYYKLFDIEMDADPATIRTAIREARKRWRQVTGSPDKERARLAELRMEQLEAAETNLLDETMRAAYDAQLIARLSVPATAPAADPVSTDWGERAKTYYYDGDVRNAYIAAKKGTDVDSENNLAWLVYVWAATDLKKYEDADFASAELVLRVPQADTSHELRGGVLDAMGRYKEAEVSFRKAVALAPSNAYYQARAAWAVLDQGRTDEAIAEAGKLIERFPDDPNPVKVLRAASESLRDKKRPHEALEVAKRILALRPGDDDAILLAVLAIQDIEKSVDVNIALAEAWKLVDAYPDNPRPQRVVRYVIGGLSQRGKDDAALVEARKLLARYPHDQDVKSTFVRVRLGEAEERMSQSGPGSFIILNKAQAGYLSAALDETAALDVTDPGVLQSLAKNREYLAAQTKVKVKLSLGKAVLGLIAIVLLFIGLGSIASGGIIWLLIAALLGWAFYSATFKKQFQLNYQAADPKIRTKGLR